VLEEPTPSVTSEEGTGTRAGREAIPALSVQVQLTKEEARKAIELYYAMSMDDSIFYWVTQK
jgi:hypothetical protein